MTANNPLPSLTPDQLILLLERLCAAGCGVTRQHQGDQFFMISMTSIQDAREILQGRAEEAA